MGQDFEEGDKQCGGLLIRKKKKKKKGMTQLQTVFSFISLVQNILVNNFVEVFNHNVKIEKGNILMYIVRNECMKMILTQSPLTTL